MRSILMLFQEEEKASGKASQFFQNGDRNTAPMDTPELMDSEVIIKKFFSSLLNILMI